MAKLIDWGISKVKGGGCRTKFLDAEFFAVHGERRQEMARLLAQTSFELESPGLAEAGIPHRSSSSKFPTRRGSTDHFSKVSNKCI